MLWDLHVPPALNFLSLQTMPQKPFFPKLLWAFTNEWVHSRSTKFLSPVLLLEFIQIKQDSVQYLLWTTQGLDKRMVKENGIEFFLNLGWFLAHPPVSFSEVLMVGTGGTKSKSDWHRLVTTCGAPDWTARSAVTLWERSHGFCMENFFLSSDDIFA